MRRVWLRLFSVAAFAGTLAFWAWALRQAFPPVVDVVCVVGLVLAVFPTVWLGRKALDREPTTERAASVSAVAHAVLMALFGTAIVEAIKTGAAWRGVELPIPRSVSIQLVRVTALLCAFTVVNLAVRGLGAPFAIALSRRLATDWLYARTRNPMVLAVLACLASVGLWQRSALFLVWLVVLVVPAFVYMLKVYEERELEIRFGDGYRAYRKATPFLWPRWGR